MGCSDSKSAVVHTSTSYPGNHDEHGGDYVEDWISADDAISHIMNEIGVTESRARRMIERINRNEDDKISNDELVKLWKKIKKTKSKLKEKFDEADIDRNGYVTMAQAEDIIRKKMPGLPESGVRAMIQRYDSDGNNQINYDEFIYFYCNLSVKRNWLERLFEERDTSGAGMLSVEETCELITEECVLEEYMARSLIEDFDYNNDGMMNQKEFANLLNKLYEGEEAYEDDD